jgi:hypothetical protein
MLNPRLSRVSFKLPYTLAISGLLFSLVSLPAFPPAPYYSLHGLIRDQTGQTIRAEGAELVLLKGTAEVGRTPINSGVRLDQNYELQMRLDQNRAGTALYTEKALPAQAPYHLVVEMGGVKFYPIEANASLTTGKGGERVRLDLNLGQDTDGDGLPDVWEQWQLFQSGQLPDENGNWAIQQIDRNGDFDGDGQSNWLEYVAGTFAGDATERFELKIHGRSASQVEFSFFGITGKTYSIERSPDMKTWTAVPFSVGQAGNAQPSWQAADVAVVSAYAAPGEGAKDFYRLTVR